MTPPRRVALPTLLSLSLSLALAACQGAAGPGVDVDDDQPGDVDEPEIPEPPCELSPLAAAVHAGAMASAPGEHSVPASLILSTRNVAEEALLRGGEIFGSMRDQIAGARRSVNIAMFVWEVGSDPHRAIEEGLEALEARLASEGRAGDPVIVRLLANVIALSGVPAEVGAPLRQAIDALDLDPRLVRVEVATRAHNGLDAMHHKLLVVDGEIVQVGGANVENVHNWRDGAVPWHDSAYRVRGEIGAILEAEFAVRWSEGDAWDCQGGACTSAPTERFYPTYETVPAAGCAPMIALVRRPTGWVNNDIDNPQDLGYLAAFAEAREVIKVQSPNLNDDAARQALLDAAVSGTRVELLLAYRFNELSASLPGQGGGNGVNVDWLYEQAFAIMGQEEACRVLDARWFADDSGVVFEGNIAGASHLKYASVDNQLTFVGSSNMDTQSWNQSGEANIAIDSAEVNARFDGKIFDPHYAAAVPTGHCP